VVVATRLDAAPVVEARRQSGVLMLLGIAAMLVLGALISFIVPAVEGGDNRHVVRVPALDSLAESGREIYVQQGCWYCHTQQVRPVVADVGLGPTTERGSESLDGPAVTGIHRIGPDLTSFSYTEDASVDLVVEYLKHPEEVVEDTNHPGYGYLSEEDLIAVATYVMADKVDIPRETDEGETDE
jgi:cbb3-type cytochrome c oxidase subunit II